MQNMVKYKGYDFCGWATRNDLRCSDGRTIRSGAFAHQDGAKVPIVWGHNHESPEAVLGHGFLENRPEGVFIYGYFNDSDLAQAAKRDVEHGDITSLSIWANQLKQKGGDVLHGSIKEVSLVLAGANMGAQITYPVIVHGDDAETLMDEAYITMGDEYGRILSHADDSEDDEDEGENDMNDNKTVQDVIDSMDEDQLRVTSYLIAKAAAGDYDDDFEHDDMGDDENGDGTTIQDVLDTMDDDQLKVLGYLVEQAAADADADDADDDEEDDEIEHDDMDDDMTVEDVIDTMDDDQLEVMNYLIENAVDDALNEVVDEYDDLEHYDFGGDDMNFNAFEGGYDTSNILTHADQMDIIKDAKEFGTLKEALRNYASNNELQHDGLAEVSGFTSYPVGGTPAGVDALFPEWHDVRPGAPEIVTNDQAWVKAVLNKVHRSPFSRIRTSQVDLRNIEGLRAKGYQKGKEKTLVDNYTVAKRTTEPQTIYAKSALNRDDVVDITDFDYVEYQYKIDRMQLEKELARAILIGDGRDAASDDKINEERVRPIWTDNQIFTIRKVISAEPASNDPGFGTNYVYAQAVEEALLDAKIDYRGSGNMDMFCSQRFFNKIQLAKDLNGRRLYTNKGELTSALDVQNVYNVPEFESLTRTEGSGVNEKTYRLLAIIGNLNDYNIGATKGGEITHFTDFDIDFNQLKSLIETRVSGANTRIYSFIVLEEEVTT
jgi:hypothetical protein